MSRYKYFNTVPHMEEVGETAQSGEKQAIYLFALHLEISSDTRKQIAANSVHFVQDANKYNIFSAFFYIFF